MALSAHIRLQIAERARNRSEYCQSQLKFSADSFSVEHIIPRSREGSDVLSNLALACQRCNNAKYNHTEAIDPLTGNSAKLFRPRHHVWSEHFAWSHDFLRILGITPTGRATVEKMQLNRAGVVNLRQVLFGAGEHPPREDL